ncbi:MAG: STAS domain-containing protein [Solirubrobacteraceae bacterium]
MSQLPKPLPSVAPVARLHSVPSTFACTRSRDDAGAIWVRVVGELDLAGAPTLAAALRDSLNEASLVILDLSGLTFLDSAGVHAIVDAGSDARSDTRRLRLVCGPHSVQRLFALTGTAAEVDVIEPGSSRRLIHPASVELAGTSIVA